MQINQDEVCASLTTIKDYIRWGASRFAEQQLFLGHGTLTPLDEAAALVLHTLYQPYNLSESYLDAVLSHAERVSVIDIIIRRIVERKPYAYLTNEALFAGLPFYVDERVLVPRSPIAECIQQNFEPWIDPSQVYNILDMCTGSGCIAIACAYAFPEAQVDAVDISSDALAVAAINVDKHEMQDQVLLYQSDLFNDLMIKPYDIIVSNPPYVSIAEWESLPQEFHAEPSLGLLAGTSGLDSVIKMLVSAGQYLSETGILIIEVGSSAETLLATFPEVPFYWLAFENGGDGVFLLTAEQVKFYHSHFSAAL